MDLSKFSVKDFVMNESFQKWILDSDDIVHNFWENWIKENPEKLNLIAEARVQLLEITSAIRNNLQSNSLAVWNRIEESLQDSKHQIGPTSNRNKRPEAKRQENT